MTTRRDASGEGVGKAIERWVAKATRAASAWARSVNEAQGPRSTSVGRRDCRRCTQNDFQGLSICVAPPNGK